VDNTLRKLLQAFLKKIDANANFKKRGRTVKLLLTIAIVTVITFILGIVYQILAI